MKKAYDLFGAVAFSLASHKCHAGSYHGATEALFRDRGIGSLQDDISVLCGNTQSPFFRHQCVHGVGHGLMSWSSYELLDALPMCDRLAARKDQLSCYSGIFMENVVGGLSGSMGHYTEYLSDDPHMSERGNQVLAEIVADSLTGTAEPSERGDTPPPGPPR